MVEILVAFEPDLGIKSVLPASAVGGVLTPGFVPAAGEDRPEPDAEVEADALSELLFEFPEDLPFPEGLALGFIVVIFV